MNDLRHGCPRPQNPSPAATHAWIKTCRIKPRVIRISRCSCQALPEVELLEVGLLGVELLGVDLLGVELLGVGFLGVGLLGVELLGVGLLEVELFLL